MIELKDLKKELTKIITESTTREVMKKASDLLAEEIKKRTRDGDGVDGKLKGLKSTTINYRKLIKLHSSTSPSKSNLTRKGTLLNSIKTTGVKKKEGVVKLTKEQGDKVLKLKKLGFEFFEANKQETNNVVELIRKEVDEAIKRFNNK
ncbi:hypothetical protein KAR91_24750 [Candidatus Pacearchaeota archaeon]|nr:hypothetical protein [Candidatus Pacearchaeota archaeon]